MNKTILTPEEYDSVEDFFSEPQVETICPVKDTDYYNPWVPSHYYSSSIC